FRLHLAQRPLGLRSLAQVEGVEGEGDGGVARPAGPGQAGDLVARGRQHVRQVPADEPGRPGDEAAHPDPRLHYRVPPYRFRSASTIICTSRSNVTCGSHPSTRFAFDASPSNMSTSAGRTNAGSCTVYFCQSSPTCANAISTSCRTVCIWPLAM